MTFAGLWSVITDTVIGSHTPVLVAGVLAGVVLVVLGWRLYIVTVLFAAAAAGATVGQSIASYMEWPDYPLMIGLAALFAIAAIPLQKLVFFLAGGIAAINAYKLYLGAPPDTPSELMIAGALFAVGGLVAFFLFRPIVIAASSLAGAGLVVLAGLALASDGNRLTYQQSLSEWRWALAGVFALLAGAGMWVQLSIGKRVRKARK